MSDRGIKKDIKEIFPIKDSALKEGERLKEREFTPGQIIPFSDNLKSNKSIIKFLFFLRLKEVNFAIF